jgi:hypothetical protein
MRIAIAQTGVFMSTAKKSESVTRRELYAILGSIYLLLACALLGVARHDQSVLMLTADYIFFGVAISLSLTYSVWGMVKHVKERERQKNEGDALTEQSAATDRPRE